LELKLDPHGKSAGTALLRVPAQLHHLLNLECPVIQERYSAMQVRNKHSHKFRAFILKLKTNPMFSLFRLIMLF